MADASIAPTKDSHGFSAVLLSVTGSGVTTVDGDFLTPMHDLIPTGYCIHYKEDTTPTSVDITWEAKVGVDSNEYVVTEADGTAFTLNFDGAEDKMFIPFVDGATGAALDFSGVNFLKPAVTANGGAGGAGAILKITVVGRLADSAVLAARR